MPAGLNNHAKGYKAQFSNGLTLLIIIVISCLSVYSSMYLNYFSENYDKGTHLLNTVLSLAYQQSAIEWQAIAEGQVNDELNEQRQELAEQMKAEILSLEKLEVEDTYLESILRLAESDQALQRIREALEHYQSAVDEEFTYLALGDIEAAETIDETKVDPGFEDLRTTIEATTVLYETISTRLQWLASFATISTIILIVAMVAYLLYRLDKQRKTSLLIAANEKTIRDINTVVKHASDLSVRLDAAGVMHYVSPACWAILGYHPEELINQNLWDKVHPENEQKLHYYRSQLLTQPAVSLSCELSFLHKDGSSRVLEFQGSNLLNDPEVAAVILSARDLSERKELNQKLEHQALHDSLTHLPNRLHFSQDLDHAIYVTRHNPLQHYALLFLDLNRFKEINDSLGHHIGDKLLLAVAKRLQSCLRPSDVLARLGGDEFVILLNNIETETAVTIAQRINNLLNHPFDIDERHIFSNTSIGIVPDISFYANSADVLRDADIAMYQAKEQQLGYVVFTKTMHEKVVERQQLETDLHQALKNRELFLVYQPIISFETQSVCGVEALLRWQHPVRGLISPAEFVPLAEETSLILSIGNWVIHEACHQLVQWQKNHLVSETFSININLSGKQLNPQLIYTLRSVIKETGVNPARLKLEVTESILIEHKSSLSQILVDLQHLGVAVIMDDFGTGYSSLSYIQHLPITGIKIDRSFIWNMETDPKAREIVKVMFALAQGLNLNIVAEGVENQKQLNLLKSMGTKYAQGYYFAKPSQADDIQMFLGTLQNKTLDSPHKRPIN